VGWEQALFVFGTKTDQSSGHLDSYPERSWGIWGETSR